jgi:hypothetical protein
MKKIFYLIVAVALVFGCTEDVPQEEREATGSIYGVVADKATGEVVRSAGVQLSPTGRKDITGSEGQYEFTELKAGNYTISVTKTGYTDLVNYKITVEAGKTNKGDVQLVKLPPSLRVVNVNDSKKDIDMLDFGSAADDVTRSFSIFNNGSEPLAWQLTETSEWITGVSKANGTLKAGDTQAVIITIDRSTLAGGVHTTTIHITSDKGSKALTVKVTEGKALPTLNTLEATDIAQTAAKLHGRITSTGVPSYTERGFVYATSPMPTLATTISKLTVAVTENNDYTAPVTGLTLGATYYVRAYAINEKGPALSTNESIFTTTMTLPEVTTQDVTNRSIGEGRATFNGTVVAEGDPAYTERGFVYGTAHNPTVGDATKNTASGSGTGIFNANITELAEGAIYYVRAYATNAKGAAYGEEVRVDFNAVMPVVTTQAVSNIGDTSVKLNGAIQSIGDPAYTERGFAYSSTHQNPSVDDGTATTIEIVSGSGTGSFSVNLTDLPFGITYYARAYATNSKGTVYGDTVSFAIAPYMVIGDLMVQREDVGIEVHAQSVSLCQESTVSGYDDWRLPTMDELKTMYAVRNIINLEADAKYWSSVAYIHQQPCCPTCPGSTTKMCTAILGYYCLDMTDGSTVPVGSLNVRARCVRTLP